MTTQYLKQLYFNFFKAHGHAIIPSASLVPENDPTVLFTPAGMHPLTPYLMGEKHPQGTRIANAQKCIRTIDIDSVGDPTHLTFFEMLGNWSLGDYFKEESIRWSFEFLTGSTYLNFDLDVLYVTVFAGDTDTPKDEESARIWRSLGISNDHIFYMPREDNFWGPVGDTGPCGPDTEIFVDTGKNSCSKACKPGCACGKYFEIWNNVFMEFEKTSAGTYIPLKQKNVDTGMGVERTVAMMNGFSSVYEIETLEPLVKIVRTHASKNSEQDRSIYIIVDHIRTAVFMLADERSIRPSNVDQGYVLRRLIRRMIRHARMIGLDLENLDELAQAVIHEHHADYPELVRSRDVIFEELHLERDKFIKTLDQGMKMFEKFTSMGTLSGEEAFTLFASYGFPIEMVEELAHEKKISVDTKTFEKFLREHQDKSRTASAGKFKGGLADHSEQTVKYHTANHMMLEALRRVLGDHVEQKGSNITAERLRFDFTHPQKVTPEEIKQIEDIVNTEISKDHDVHFEEMSVDEAKKIGATGVFQHKYGDIVKVYFVGDYSKEICGGPHVANTHGMGTLKITQEKASSAGVRRIKAILE